MVNTPISHTRTKLRVALRDEDGTSQGGETLWAQPVAGQPGRFALHNNAFGASLRLHDVVRAEPDGCGRLQVVGFEALHPGPVTLVQLPGWLEPDEAARTADSWRTLGSEHSEGNGMALVTAWVAGATPQSACEVVAATAPGWRMLDIATAPIRQARLRREVDLRLDPRTPRDLAAEHDALCDCERREEA